MGWEWEVEQYVMTEHGWRWTVAYQGDSEQEAKAAVDAAAGRGVGAIRTTWRPA